MPATEELPSFDRFVRAYQGALVSQRRYADTHAGAIHMHWARVGAVLWRRQVERDAEEFRALYFNTAEDERFDDYLASHFPGKSRLPTAAGTGSARLTRPTAAAGSGTIWAKTRIAVGGAGVGPLAFYYVSRDSIVGAADTEITLDVEASDPGPASKISARAGDRPVLRVEDPLWDNSWQVQALDVGEGSLLERAEVARGRIRGELFEERLGFESAIIKRMKAEGAATVVLFRSDFLGAASDCGLNRVYVADANFETSPELLRACRFALPDVTMAGSSAQALPMTTVWLTVSVQIRFWDSPEKFGEATVTRNAQAAVAEYFEARENPFLWDVAGVQGAIRRAVEDTQEIEVTASLAPPTALTLFNSSPLPRYRVRADQVAVRLVAPSG